MAIPTRDEFSFGLQTSRRGDSFREGKTPFTGEVVRFYNSTATPEECRNLETVLGRFDIKFDADALTYRGQVGGTNIYLPNIDLSQGYFGGASIELVGELISHESLEAVLEMGRSASLFFENSTGEGALAAPNLEVGTRVQSFRDAEVLLVDTPEALRSWLVEHVGSRKVI